MCDKYIGIGYSITKLPTNTGVLKVISPDGETSPGSFNILIGDDTPYKISYGFSFFKYSINKFYSDYYGRANCKWKVFHYNAFLSYRTLLGQNETLNPSLGLRIGGSLIPIDLSGTFLYEDYYWGSFNNTTKVAPYVGADFLIPIVGYPVDIYGSIEKSFCKYNDINIGGLAVNMGIVYVFRKK